MKHTQREKQRAKKTCRYTAGRLQLLHQGHESVFVGGRLSALLPPPAVVKKGIVWWQGILPLRTHTPLKEGRETLFRGGRRSAERRTKTPSLFSRQQGVAAGPRVCHQRRHSRDPGEAVGDVQLCTCNGCFSRCVCFMLNLVTFSTLGGKPSALRAETYSCRTLPKPRLTSCTRKIRSLHLESKCEHPIRGGPSGVPIV